MQTIHSIYALFLHSSGCQISGRPAPENKEGGPLPHPAQPAPAIGLTSGVGVPGADPGGPDRDTGLPGAGTVAQVASPPQSRFTHPCKKNHSPDSRKERLHGGRYDQLSAN